MTFARQSGVAVILVAMTLWLQCAAMSILIRLARNCLARRAEGLNPWRVGVVIARFTGAIIVLHILQIMLWAGFYRWQCLSSWESCFYFSAGSYSTIGSADVVLPRVWRDVGPVESITGVVMSGISVSVLFAIANRLVAAEDKSGVEGQQTLHPALPTMNHR
jgi:voltage-gated potassium channel